MKSALPMSREDASSAPTLTDEPWPNSTPFGLTRNTLPFALKLPRMTDGSAPSTRLSATELLPGWTKRTLWPAPILKLCQSMTTFALDWLMTILLVPVLIVAAPAVTTPPVGDWAPALAAHAIATASASILIEARTWPGGVPAQEELGLPALAVCSDTATKVPVWSFQMDR